MPRRLFLAAFTLFCLLPQFQNALRAQEEPKVLKAGIIGLDTSHCIAFTKLLNNPEAEGVLATCRVVAAYPKGSPDIKSSTERVPKYTQELRDMGIEIVNSIPELLEQVDVVFLETNDGRPHLAQVIPVLEAGKPVFVDKPLAGSLRDGIVILEAAEKHGVPLFSSSSLRFAAKTQEVRNGSIGKVTHCETGSPASIEPTHPDLFWYGIHGVEALFTMMGPGCQSVRRYSEDGKIVVEGKWEGGRVGIFREGKYGGIVKGTMGETTEAGKSDGYAPLLDECVKFFHSGKPPVSAAETLEIYAFMEAADESKRRGGEEVALEEVMKRARGEGSGGK